jgi:poly(3-hydroxybutyrate) depolymerase
LNTTSDVQYGQNINLNGNSQDLFLDVYEPQGDAMLERPLIIWAHGGSFISGDKTGTDVKPLAEDFAKMGYVTASISYRLGMNGIPLPGPDSVDATETVIRAVHDARAAVRFFKKDYAENGNTYGIDTSNIYFGGVSAGGVTAVHLAYLDKESEMPTDYIDTSQAGLGGGIEGNSGNPGYSGNVKAIINSAGALRDTAWMEAGSTPVISFHGDADGTVPYGTDIISMIGIFPIMMVDGSSSIHEQAENLGMNNCFEPWPGQGHVPHVGSAAYYDTLVTMSANFLSQFMCSTTNSCAYVKFTSLTMTISVTIDNMGSCDGTATVAPSGGIAPYTYLWDDPNTQTSATATGLCTGNHTVIVVDSNGDTITATIHVPAILGIPAHRYENAVAVYPNPAGSYAKVIVKNGQRLNARFELYDAVGNMVRTQNMLYSDELLINRDGLPGGMYFIKILHNEGQYTAKLIFE